MRGLKLLLALLVFSLATGCTTKSSQEDTTNSAYEAYSRLGFEYLQTGDTVNAKSAFQRSLQVKSDYAEAHNGLALAFQLEGDDTLAEKYFRKATALAPQSAMMHNNFGAFLFASERFSEACTVLARATEDPFYNRRSQAFENLGRCYLKIQRADAAEHAFKRALQVSANRPISLVELSDLLIKKQNYVEAEKYFDRFLRLVENRRVEHYAKSLWVGVRLARKNNNVVQSATYALILKSMYPDSPEYKKYKEMVR